jgi:hypothetical protein
MPRRKLLGHGTQVSINGSAYGLLKTFKPAESTREAIDVTVMEDEITNFYDADPPTVGVITITGFWDPDDAAEIAIDNFFYNDDLTEREATVALRIRNVGTGTAPAASTWTYTTITYTGRITKLSPAEITQKGEVLRTIELQPTARPVQS